MFRWLLCIGFLVVCSNMVEAQEHKSKLRLSGQIIDAKGNPLQGVMVFIDKVKTKEKSNKKGRYTIKMDPDVKLVSVYTPDLGILSAVYEGQSKLDFKYPQESVPITEDMLDDLGFALESDPELENHYSDFSSVLEILDKRFFNVRVTNGEIKIGKGLDNFTGDRTPLILVDQRQVVLEELNSIATSDIQNIRVISSGSEAAEYGGLKASNGVILITLKNNK